jgi:hypothetical protein
MGGWKLYDYVDAGGTNDFAGWCREIQRPDLARLNRKLKMLADNGPDLGPKLLAGPLKGYAHIHKIIVNGRVALRPLLCKGPINNDPEFTLLKGAFERDGEWVPSKAREIAVDRRQEVINDSNARRCPHEVVSR